MIIHLLFESEYTFSFNKMIKDYFNIDNHLFIIRGNSSWNISNEYNFLNSIKVNTYEENIVLNYLVQAESIIIHGLFDKSIVELFHKRKELIKKVVWVVWGGDLYLYREVGSENNPFEFEEKRKFVIGNIGYMTGLKDDYYLAKDVYGTNAIHFEAGYEFLLDFNNLDSLPNKYKTDLNVNILLGNSATQTNLHIDALNKLDKFKSNQIKIFAPLSYGDPIYAKEIADYGLKIFNNKFVPMFDFVEPIEYNKLLNSIDIGIMNHSRQQASGSVFGLLYLGKKLYMNKNNLFYSYLKRNNVNVSDIELLNYITYEDFSQAEITDTKDVKIFLRDNLSREAQALKWKEIFKLLMYKKNQDSFIGNVSLSVIIPTYNRADMVPIAIKSALMQSYPITEIIIADDGSTDNTELIVKELSKIDNRVKYTKQSKSGAQAARNLGIKSSIGEWIAFLDSDDEWMPDYIKKAISVAENRNVGVVYSNFIKREIKDNKIVEKIMNPPVHEKFVFKQMLEKSFISFPGLLVRRNCLNEIGLLDESIPSWQEWETGIRLAEKFDFAYNDTPSFYWNWHDRETISKNLVKDAFGILCIIAKHKDKFLSLAGYDCTINHLKNASNKINTDNSEAANLLKNKIYNFKNSLPKPVDKQTSTSVKSQNDLKYEIKGYIAADETLKKAREIGLGVSDYVEQIWDQKGDTDKVINSIVKVIDESNINSILEIGPGTGRYLERMKRIYSPTIFEVYETAMDWNSYLRKEFPDLVIRIADGYTLNSTKNNSIDLVCAHGVFVYLSFTHCFEYFNEMIRVCKKGGYIVFDYYNSNHFTPQIINKWITSGHKYPTVLDQKNIKDFFVYHNLNLIDSFNNKYGQSFSNYVIFQKGF